MTTKIAVKNEGPGIVLFKTFNGRKFAGEQEIAVGDSLFGTVYKGQTFRLEEKVPTVTKEKKDVVVDESTQ